METNQAAVRPNVVYGPDDSIIDGETVIAKEILKAIKECGIKDSGKREEYASGMVRDTAEDKIDYSLVLDGPMFARWAVHMTKGAKKYSKRNWMKASGEAEFERATESLTRHFIQYVRGDTDEDHAAAVMFNLNLREYVRGKL